MGCTSLLSPKAAFFAASAVLVLIIHAFGDTFPPGHLEPLGARNPKQSLDVLDTFPSPQEFFQSYVSQMKPVLFRGGAKLSPAFSKWSDEYFLAHEEAGNLRVVAEKRKKENRTYPSQDMSLREFVQTYEQEDIYMVDSVPSFLMEDVLLPAPLLCEDVELVDTVMWFSSGGTRSVLHNDDVDNINCLFSGVKELLFIDYNKYKDKVPIDFRVGGYSGVDVDRVDMIKYPGLKDVEYYNVTMQPGDCLFIPYKCVWMMFDFNIVPVVATLRFHQVRSYDRNIAVNVWWTHKADFVPQKCNMDPNQSLENFKFPAQGGDGEDKDILDNFGSLLSKEDKLAYTAFEKKLREEPSFPIMSGQQFEWTEEFKEATMAMFDALDKDKDGYFSVADLESLKDDGAEKVRMVLENEVAKVEDLIEDQVEPYIASSEQNKPREEL